MVKYTPTSSQENVHRDLLLVQGGKCAICNRSDKTLIRDHDHTTGEIRGLLCHSCNIRLGHRYSVGNHYDALPEYGRTDWDKSAIRYLKDPPGNRLTSLYMLQQCPNCQEDRYTWDFYDGINLTPYCFSCQQKRAQEKDLGSLT